MSHALEAAAELFEAIEKDARTLVFPVSELAAMYQNYTFSVAP